MSGSTQSKPPKQFRCLADRRRCDPGRGPRPEWPRPMSPASGNHGDGCRWQRFADRRDLPGGSRSGQTSSNRLPPSKTHLWPLPPAGRRGGLNAPDSKSLTPGIYRHDDTNLAPALKVDETAQAGGVHERHRGEIHDDDIDACFNCIETLRGGGRSISPARCATRNRLSFVHWTTSPEAIGAPGGPALSGPTHGSSPNVHSPYLYAAAPGPGWVLSERRRRQRKRLSTP